MFTMALLAGRIRLAGSLASARHANPCGVVGGLKRGLEWGGLREGARPAAAAALVLQPDSRRALAGSQELQDVDTEQGLSWGFNNPTYSQDISTADSSTTRSEMGDHTNFLASCEEPLQALSTESCRHDLDLP